MLKKIYRILIPVIFLFLFTGCSNFPTTIFPEQQEAAQQSAASSLTPPNSRLQVHFLDVGQADSILVQLPNGQNMLVDAGNNNDDVPIVNYLKQLDVKQIDFLIGTHPHEDHIGGLDTVIKKFKIGKVYLPRVTTTTRTFEDVLKALQVKGLKITPARAGVQLVNTGKLKAVILAPQQSDYEDMNNYSAVIKITYDQVSFLLTGDAGEQSESEMLLSSAVSPKADVLKISHHGSRFSTSKQFLKVVQPKYAVISVGDKNVYGHPHRETLEKLKGIQVYRTDRDGTIIFSTDGKKIEVTKQ